MGGKKDEDKDLRKEVEMTEHTDSIEKVCQQYQTCGEKGLTDSAVEDVSLEWSIFPSETPIQGSTSRLGPAGDPWQRNEPKTLHFPWENRQKPSQIVFCFQIRLRLVLIRLITRLD